MLCDQANGIVKNLDECKSVALLFNFRFNRQEYEQTYPQGCYVFSRRVYLNNHPNGSMQEYSQQVCKRKGTFLVIIMSFYNGIFNVMKPDVS